jgi:hypothetical protein
MPRSNFRLPAIARSTVLLAVALAAAACSGANPSPSASRVPSPGASSAPMPSPSAAPSSGPTVGAIDHRTGAADVILRLEHGGGMVPIDFLATQAPVFTLFGNGVIVFQPTVTTYPEPDANGVLKAIPWRTGSLDEGQVQELLAFALEPGGLGRAREVYMADGIADAPNTIFTIHAGGIDKTVTVNALSEMSQPGPDTVARAAFAVLAKRLEDFDRGGTIPSDVYAADRHRGILIVRDPGAVAIDWPWPALKPSDFTEGPNDGSGGPTLPHRTMTADEIAALKLTGIEGGVQGLAIKGPDGKTYNFTLRPLLADEKE